MSFQNAFGNRSIYNYLPLTESKGYEGGTFFAAIQQDLPTLIFISRIPKEFDDDDMNELLNACGSVKSWKRAKNIDTTLTHYGFCIFEDVVGVIKALKSIAPDRPVGYEWSQDDPKYPLIVTADVATKNSIRSHPEMKSTERDPIVLEKLKKLYALTLNSKENDQETIDKKLDFAEKERLEKREKERWQAIIDKEKKIQLQEGARIKKYLADLSKEKEVLESREKKRAALFELYDAYNDDKEASLDSDLYYRDRDRWWHERKRIRGEERDLDQRDKRAEEEEIEFALAQEREAAEAGRLLQEQKAAQEAAAAENEKDEEKSGMVEVSVSEQQSDIHVTRIMTVEERKAAIKELVATIPVDKEGLWEWNVKWDKVDQSMITHKLEPFLKKKVVEYIGDESFDLVTFILEKIASHSSVETIFDELSPVLLEDTEIFCLKFWRFLIYESEARSAGLS